jgi:hypothetical protein
MGLLIGGALAAIVFTGCVDPYYNQRYGHYQGSYPPSYQEGYYPPPDHRHDRDDREDYKVPKLVCESQDGRPARCRTKFPIARAEVDKRYSGSPCEYGRSWGFDSNEVWVDRGCRARFVLTPAGRWR